MTNRMRTISGADSVCCYGTVDDVVRDAVSAGNIEEPFYVIDVEDILNKHKNWLRKLPRVRQFYAVKCNGCPAVLELLAALGIGFDCASKAEIETMLEMNVHPTNIIFANPCKTTSFIKYAASVGVDMMTFDNEPELYKIARCHPGAKLVLRIKVDDSHAVCRFSAKFGADLDKVEHLLTLAKSLSLNIVGVSFHVGSGCESAKSYADAIANAKYVFTLAKEMGFSMTVLDLGGGFPGTSRVSITFDEIASVINQALDQHFPECEEFENLNIIAEPGRYYVASAFTLATMVIAKRILPAANNDEQSAAMYYLNDGVYGSFNCTIFDHCEVYPEVFKHVETIPASHDSFGVEHLSKRYLNSTLWGPTCDSMDCIKKNVILPELEVGQWLVFREMGAYTIAAASTFNGFQLPSLKYFVSESAITTLRLLQAWPK